MDYRTERGYREIDQPYVLHRFYVREAIRARNQIRATRLVMAGLLVTIPSAIWLLVRWL